MTTSHTDPPCGEYEPVGRSVLAKRVVLLPPRMRKLLGVNDYIVATIDFIVTLCTIVLEEDEAPLLQRINAATEEFGVLREEPAWITRALQQISEPELAAWARRLQRADHKKTLNRLLGTAMFNQLRQDLNTDARTVLATIRIGVNLFRPWALAIDDSLGMLTQAQKDDAGVPGTLMASFFGMALNLEELLGVTLADQAALKFPQQTEQHALSEDEVQAAMNQLRLLVRASAEENLADLSEVFSRKMRGAREAMEFSVDGVSQAANSIVELIDRIAREAFTEDEVSRWLESNDLSDERHSYVTPKGDRRPTKRAQLMCLAWAGSQIEPAGPPSVSIHKIAAYTLLNVRDNLQKLKHSDANTDEERALLIQYLGTIEGTIMLMINACWITAGPQQVQAIRAQFSNPI